MLYGDDFDPGYPTCAITCSKLDVLHASICIVFLHLTEIEPSCNVCFNEESEMEEGEDGRDQDMDDSDEDISEQQCWCPNCTHRRLYGPAAHTYH